MGSMYRTRWAVPVALCLCLAAGAAAESSAPGSVRLAPFMEILDSDPPARGDLAAARVRVEEFYPLGRRDANLGHRSSGAWIRVPLGDLPSGQGRRLLEIGNPSLDRVEVYLIGRDGVVQSHEGGRILPFDARDVLYRTFVFPLSEQVETTEMYVRVEASGALMFPMSLYTADAFLTYSHRDMLLWGGYLGVLLALSIYHLLLYASVRRRYYLHYAGVAATFMFFQATDAGLAYQFIWPSLPGFNAVVAEIFGALLLLFLFFLSRNYLRLNRLAPWLDRAARAVLAVTAVWTVLIPLLGPSVAMRGLMVLAAAFFAVAGIGCYLGIRAGHARTRYYAVALGGFGAAGLGSVLHNLGVLAGTVLTTHGIKIGSLFLVVALSVGIGSTIAEGERDRRRQRAERRRLAGVHDFTTAVTSTLRADHVARYALDRILALTPWGSGIFVSLAEHPGVVMGVAGSGADCDEGLRLSESQDQSLRVMAARPGLRRIVWSEVGDLRMGESDAVHILSIYHKARLLGAVIAPGEPEPEGRATEAILSDFAVQAGTALENSRLLAEAHERAERDPLTGLYNRMGFLPRAEQCIMRTVGRDTDHALIMLDIDHFKQINDRYGHPAGDEVLKWLGQLLPDLVREEDLLARYGGEEFVIFLPDTDPRTAWGVAERIRERIACGGSVGKMARLGSVTVSLGVASVSEESDSLFELIDGADRQLYRAKEAGRNRVAVG